MGPVRRDQTKYPSLFEVEKVAVSISKKIGLENVFPKFRYRFLCDLFSTRKFGCYSIIIVPDDDLDCAAFVDQPNKRLLLRASLHSSGLRGEAHPLMVLLHETVHVWLGHDGIRKKIPGLDIRKLADPSEKFHEWLANRVAGAIAMPFSEAIDRKCKDEADLAREFSVTQVAAEQRMPQIKEMSRLQARERKTPSPKFWHALYEYEKKTGSKLGIIQEREASKGYMLCACPRCGQSTGTIKGENVWCNSCDATVTSDSDLTVSLPWKEL